MQKQKANYIYICSLDFQTRREFDTETMTTAELREALALKQLSTKGTKHQLQVILFFLAL